MQRSPSGYFIRQGLTLENRSMLKDIKLGHQIMDQTHLPISDLIRSVIGSASSLAKAEISLFRAEMRGKIKDSLSPVIMIAAAAGLLLIGAFVLSGALVLLLIHFDVTPYVAAFGVAAVFLIAGAGIIMSALSSFEKLDMMPTRTLAQLREDATVIGGRSRG